MLITLQSGTVGLKGLRRVRETIKLSARAMLHRQAVDGWLQLLNSSPLFTDLVADHPRMIYKIFRPYFSNTMDHAARLNLLSEHYRFILRQGLGPLTAANTRTRSRSSCTAARSRSTRASAAWCSALAACRARAATTACK